jgi:hypothetical protein
MASKQQSNDTGKVQGGGSGALDFDDGDMVHPRGTTTGAGRTGDEKKPSDAGELGTPDVGMSDRNGPSDPDAKRTKRNE